ncbi:BA75_02555T0 [Komagataella pastoris]|uniref:BA75_02555T0 n=1 Tax=Komagataella pastoris TaxID=4922 RepID=A0A1B2JB15_PICPA|nr:BA75_02555T0 [Komagataella pastoris]
MPDGPSDPNTFPKDGITISTAEIEQTLRGVDILERQRLVDQLPNYNDRLFFTKFFKTYIVLPDTCGQLLMDCEVSQSDNSNGITAPRSHQAESGIEYDPEADDFLKYEREMELEMILREKVEKILKSDILRPGNRLCSSTSVQGSTCSIKPRKKDMVEYDYEGSSFFQKLWKKLSRKLGAGGPHY